MILTFGRIYLMKKSVFSGTYCVVIYTLAPGRKNEAEIVGEIVEEIHKIQPDALCARNNKITAAMMDGASTIKVVAKHGVGYDSIDVAHATEKKIQVVYVPDGNFISVAEHAMFLIMACARRYEEVAVQFRKGNFGVRNDIKDFTELRGKVLGIMGCGHIGSALAEIAAKGFGMKVLGYSRHLVPGTVSEGNTFVAIGKEEMLKQADFLVLAMPSTPETKYSFTYNDFKNMKKSACFINIARGDIVIEADFIKALQDNLLRAAATDVFDSEPPDIDNPLLKMNNVVVTPHSAGLTVDAMKRTSLSTAQQIVDVLEGRAPKWPVN